jgi:hypothetical protein
MARRVLTPLISIAGALALSFVMACGSKQSEPTTPPPSDTTTTSPEGGDGYGAPTPDTAPSEVSPPAGAPPAPTSAPPPANPCGN